VDAHCGHKRLLLLLLQESAHFKKKADELHKRVALAEQDAGGNREELTYKLNKVRLLVSLVPVSKVFGVCGM
jgi:hypothetical protein